MQTNFSYIKKIAVVSGLILGAFSLSVLANWSAPISAPPICASGNPGCDAPIHVGSNAQTKTGKLSLGTDINNTSTLFDVLGNAVMTTIGTNSIIVNGSASAGSLAVTNAATAGSVTATGNVKGATLESTGLTTTGSLKVTDGATNGYYLKTDGNGLASWAPAPTTATPTITVSGPFSNMDPGDGGNPTTMGAPFQYKACFLTRVNILNIDGDFTQGTCRINHNSDTGTWSLQGIAPIGDKAICEAMCF